MPISITVKASLLLLSALLLSSGSLAFQNSTEREREKANARQQFSQNFHDLQVQGQQLLREHEAGQLTPTHLLKKAKSINKSAKALRTLMALGDLAQEPEEVGKDLSTALAFDQSIKRLSKLIYDFAHSPHHQNNKVFDTVEAAKVQRDLLIIIS